MIKIKFLFSLLLISGKLFAQDLENIKSRDTVYILFDANEKYDDLHLKVSKNKITETYLYVFPDAKYLSFRTYIGKPLKKNNLCRNKSFLEKNKSKIITIERIHNTGFYKTIKTLFDKKTVIYIIEKTVFKKRKIYLKRAYMENTPEVNI